MYPISSDILNIFQSGAMQYARISIGSMTIFNDRIRQGGFTANRFAETGDTVKVGSCSAAELTVVLDNRDGAYDDYDFIGKEAFVEVGVEYNNSITYVPFGYFIFDEAGYDKSALRLASLDRMIKFERTIDPAQLTFPMTVTQLLGRLCTVCGVPLGTFPTLLNGGISIPSLPKDAKTYRDLLVWIAEISGNVAYIDYNGSLMLGWYNGSQFRITPDIRRDGTLERGSILVTGVEIVVNDTTTLQGTDARTIRVENNPLIPAGQESFIATGLFNKVGGFSYTPFSAAVLPMPHIFPLDGATYVTASGDETYVPITDWTFTLNGGTKIAGSGNQATYRRGYGLADAILQGVNLADKAVTTDKIADNAVDTAQLAALAVKEGNLAANAVTEGKIAANAVVADKIAAGAISTDKLAALAVTSAKIAAGAVTADKIYVEDLSALRAKIANWDIGETALTKSRTVSGTTYSAGLYAPTNITGDSEAVKVQAGTTVTALQYDGTFESRTGDTSGLYTRLTIDGEQYETENQYYDAVNTQSDRYGHAYLVGSDLFLENTKRNRGTSTNQRPAFEAELAAAENMARLDLVAYTGTNTTSDIHAEASANATQIEVWNGDNGSILGYNKLQVNNHNLLTLTPHLVQVWATQITANANLNTETYCIVGQYFCMADATAQTLTNCPTPYAFVMTVEAPIQTEYDNPSSGTRYRVRRITTYIGDEYIQNVTKSSGTWSFGNWTRYAKETSASMNRMINALSTGSSAAQRDDYLIAQFAGGGTTTTDYYRRSVANVLAALNSTDVTTALGYTPVNKANWASIGSSGNPVYFNASGNPTAMSGSDIVNGLSAGSDPANRNDYIVAQYANGGTTNTTYYRRSLAKVFAALNSGDITTALGYTPIDKSGDTMTGNLTLDNKDVILSNGNAERTFRIDLACGLKTYFLIGGSLNQGIYSNGYSTSATSATNFTASAAYIIRRGTDGNVYIPLWASKGSSTKPVYFDSNGYPTAVSSMVTSVAVSGDKGISVSGSPITSSGTITVSVSTSSGTASRNTTNTSAGTVKYTKYGRVVTVYTTTEVSISSSGAALNKTYFSGLPKPSEAVTFVGAGASNKAVPLKITTDGYIQAAFSIPPSGSLTIGCTYIAAS